MFERGRPVALAAALGYVLAGFTAALAVGLGWWAWRQDPFQQTPNWSRVVQQHANQSVGIAVAFLLVFALAVVALFFWLGVMGRARRGKHPTSATLGGIFLSAGLLAVAAAAVWNGIVTPYVALLHRWTPDAAYRQALFAQVITGTFLRIFSVWCFVLFGSLGLYSLGRALREVRGWLPDALRLAAAFGVLSVPVTLYLAQESLLKNHYVRWLAVAKELLFWGWLAVATYLAARWLWREARTLYATAHLSKN